jgi:hypothetical protein
MDGDLLVDGGQIGLTADSNLISMASGALTVNGTVDTTGDGTFESITMASGKQINLVDTGEYLSGDGTDLTIGSGALINLTATSDVAVPANVGVTFGTGEKWEGDNTDLTATSGGDIILNQTTYVGIGTTNPTSELDVGGGSAGTIDGTDDLLVKDDAEIDGDLIVDGTAIFSSNNTYDSGWVAINDDTTYTDGSDGFADYALGTTVALIQVWVSTVNDESVDEYLSGYVDQNSSGTNRGVAVVDFGNNTFSLRTMPVIYGGRDSSGDIVTIDSSGYCRVKIFTLE